MSDFAVINESGNRFLTWQDRTTTQYLTEDNRLEDRYINGKDENPYVLKLLWTSQMEQRAKNGKNLATMNRIEIETAPR